MRSSYEWATFMELVLYLVPSPVSLPLPLRKWMGLVGLQDGGGKDWSFSEKTIDLFCWTCAYQTFPRIFILEGLLTVVAAVATPFLLPNDPMSCKFLNDTEKKHVINRLREFQQTQRAVESDPFKWEYFWQAFTDWKVWMSILVYWGNAMPIYG